MLDPRARRKEQNRQAQRHFRERKERYVKELEDQINQLKQEHEAAIKRVTDENARLRARVGALERRLRQGGLEAGVDGDDEDTLMEEPMDGDAAMGDGPTCTTAEECVRDKDGVSFCARLKDEVCSSAYQQLLSEPLFDATGSLDTTVTSRPVPIVTEKLQKNTRRTSSTSSTSLSPDQVVDDNDPVSFLDRLAQTLVKEQFEMPPHPDTLEPDVKLISCSEAWKMLSTHPRFDTIDSDTLVRKVRGIAKCSNDGPVFTEHELKQVLRDLDKRDV
ncbi:hypothetical protein BC940DRAFT_112194 [Gongronella butleri]|nr:hypothetical protein BC940DRAFT_112194 [Gongronella butleri]